MGMEETAIITFNDAGSNDEALLIVCAGDGLRSLRISTGQRRR
jgi:hypothetical protein